MKSFLNCLALDFRLMKPYLKGLCITLGLFAVMCIIIRSGDMLLTMCTVCLLMLVAYPFAIAEKNQLDTLYGTLPVRRKDIVLGRYSFAVLLAVVGTVLSLIGAVIIYLIYGKTFDFLNLMFIAIMLLSIFFIIISLQFPTMFKSGFTKSRLLSYIPLLIFAVLIALVPVMGRYLNTDISLANVFKMLASNAVIVCIGMFVLGIAAVVISYFVSCKIYIKKDN